MPLSENSVNLAGQGSKIGGTVARIIGWLVLGGGLLLALILMALFQAIFPAGFAGFVIGGGIAALTLVIAIVLLRGGKNLQAGGKDRERDERVRAIFAFAQARAGIVRAADLAPVLRVSVETVDALLTELAKTKSDYVSLEFDDQGVVYYRVDASGRVRTRVDAIPSPQVRVGETPENTVNLGETEEQEAQRMRR